MQEKEKLEGIFIEIDEGEEEKEVEKAAQHEVLPPSEADVQTLVQPPSQPPSPHIFQHLIRSAYSSSSLFQSHIFVSL